MTSAVLAVLAIIFLGVTLAGIAAHWHANRTCGNGGCGHQVKGDDDKCAVCRLPLDRRK